MSTQKEKDIEKEQDNAKERIQDISADFKDRSHHETNKESEDRDIGQTDVKLKPIEIDEKK